jgi:hypothetical protein
MVFLNNTVYPCNHLTKKRIIVSDYSFSRASTVMRPTPWRKTAVAFWMVREQADLNS